MVHFWVPLEGPPGEMVTKMRDAASGTDLHIYAKFRPNMFCSFGVDMSRTYR